MDDKKIQFILTGIQQCENLSETSEEFQNVLIDIFDVIEGFLEFKMKNNSGGLKNDE